LHNLYTNHCGSDVHDKSADVEDEMIRYNIGGIDWDDRLGTSLIGLAAPLLPRKISYHKDAKAI
jgi:hypothetical protein